MSQIALLTRAAAALGLGTALGFWWRPLSTASPVDGDPCEERLDERPDAPSPTTQPLAREAPRAPEDLDHRRRRLRLENAVLRGQIESFEGVEQPWPEDLPEGFEEAAFGEELEAALEQAGGVLRGLSCEEFPCIAAFELPVETVDVDACWSMGREALAEQPVAWASTAIEAGRDPDGTPYISCVLAPVPQQTDQDDAFRLRVQHRVETLQAELRGVP